MQSYEIDFTWAKSLGIDVERKKNLKEATSLALFCFYIS